VASATPAVRNPPAIAEYPQVHQFPENQMCEDEPESPVNAIGSSTIVEEIDINGHVQKVVKKTYKLMDGRTETVTHISSQ
jgi:PBP1b-binding outer membrane lipoprotein LpoB